MESSKKHEIITITNSQDSQKSSGTNADSIESNASTIEIADAEDGLEQVISIAPPAYNSIHEDVSDNKQLEHTQQEDTHEKTWQSSVISKPHFAIGRDDTSEKNYNTITSITESSSSEYGNFVNTTMERPPNIEHYRMTVSRELKRGRASMPQLMHGGSAASKRQMQPSSRDQQKGLDEKKKTAAIAIEYGLEDFTATKPVGSMKRSSSDVDTNADLAEEPKKTIHFFDGVFIPAFTNIVGTLLYLRMGYVAGQAGIVGGIGIVLFSSFVISITALSLSAICSNGKQLKAGVYYIISRSLGPQFGGVIGVIFSLANVGMAALYIVGIAEFVSDLLTESGYSHFTLSKQDDIRVFSLVLCVFLMLIAFAGPDIENSFTLVFFSTYILSYVNWLLGTLLPVDEDKFIRGVTGYSWVTVQMNLMPNFRDGESLISVFAVFFPGFTGMLAGTMYVDQLRNPGTDIGIGLFTSLATTTGMYVVAVIACGATMLRDASGIEEPYIDNSTGLWHEPDCAESFSCRYGLMNYYQVAELTSAWRPLIIIGMFGMTISSTMTNLDQGPQNFQAACKDAIFPYMKYFAKEYGKNNTPRRAYVLLAFFTMGLTLIGDLNVLNEIVTNMFMATYALVNYACFDASFVRSPGWRPHFAYYNMWISLFGASMCVFIMFIVSSESFVAISLIFGACLAYFHYSHPEVNWGDTHQAHIYRNALTNLLKLTSSVEHVKNYRPQIMLLSGNPASRIPLLDFAHSITKGDSLLTCAHIVKHSPDSRRLNTSIFNVLQKLGDEMDLWLRKNKLKAFYQNLAHEDIRSGMATFFQLSGLGKLRPNVIMMGFKLNWSQISWENLQEIDNYVGIIRDAFEKSYGVCILRNGKDGFDLSDALLEHDIKDIDGLKKSVQSATDLEEMDNDKHAIRRTNTKRRTINLSMRTIKVIPKFNPHATARSFDHKKAKFFSDRHIFDIFDCDDEEDEDEDLDGVLDSCNITATSPTIHTAYTDTQQRELRRSRSETLGMSTKIKMKLEKEFAETEALAKRMNAFSSKRRRNGRIDVWWLYDDGGLTLLIPHLLRLPKSYLEGAELRVLTLCGSNAEVDEQSMIALLSKFRIEFSCVKVIEVLKQKLHPDIMYAFNKLIKPWRTKNGSSDPSLVTDEELLINKKRTYRQLLTRQLLIQHSYDASLIVVTLPVPRECVSNCLYMAWLDLMTRDLPPVLMVRGNQTSVLTFYS
uniref:Uncharacterized protein n=1 Tax=Ditylenchus dipsaci TaxID=166011 RepID=A0A915DS04_9BILA